MILKRINKLEVTINKSLKVTGQLQRYRKENFYIQKSN